MTDAQLRYAMEWSREEHEDFILRFPRLTGQAYWSGTWSLFSIPCSRGWRPLLERCLDVAEPLADVRIGMVKQKWGELRIVFDYPGEQPDLERVVDDVRAESARTCEACGAPGEPALTASRWIRTLCTAHLPDGAAFVPLPSSEHPT